MNRKSILLPAIALFGFLIGDFCFAQDSINPNFVCVKSISSGIVIPNCEIGFGEAIALKNETENASNVLRSKWEIKDAYDGNAKYIVDRVCCKTGDADPSCTNFCDGSIDSNCSACHISNIYTNGPKRLKAKLTITDNIGNKTTSDEKLIIINSTPPVAQLVCPPPCFAYFDKRTNKLTSLLNIENDSYDPDGAQEFVAFPFNQKSEWYLKSPAENVFVYRNRTTANSNYALQDIDINTTGLWRAKLIMTDRWGTKSSDNCSNCELNFSVISDLSTDFECSVDNEAWKPCEGMKVKIKGNLYVRDLTVPSQSASISSRQWIVMYIDDTPIVPDYSPDPVSKTKILIKPEKLGRIKISLHAQDTAGRKSENSYLVLSIPALLPQWEADVY